jgi:hypothetical protein
LIDFVTDLRALSMPSDTTVAQVEGDGLATGRLMFSGDRGEVSEHVKSNVRDLRQLF